MAPLQKKAPRRRGDTIAVRSDGIISTDVSSAFGLFDGSLDGQKVGSNPYDNVSPSATPQVISPASNGTPTPSTPNTSPTPTSSSISTDTRTLLDLLSGAPSLTSAQSTDSLSTLVSTASNPDLTSSVMSSSPASSVSLPSATTVPLETSTAANALDTITPSYFNGQDTQTSTPGSNVPSLTPDGTNLIRDDLSATSTLSSTSTSQGNDTLGVVDAESTDGLDLLNPVISTSEVPLAATTDPVLVSTTSDTPTTTTSTPTLTLTSTLPPDTPIPTPSSTDAVATTSGNPLDITTTSSGGPNEISVSTSETIDIAPVSSTTTIAIPSAAVPPNSNVGTTLATLAPSLSPLPNGITFADSTPFTFATSSSSGEIGTAVTPVSAAQTNFADNPPTSTEAFSPNVAVAALTSSFFTTNVGVTSSSFTQVSGSTIVIPVTGTVQTNRPSVVPVSSNSPKRSVPVAAIAASISTVIVLIVIVIGFLWVRRKQRTPGVFRDFSQVLETREESFRSPSLPVLPPLQTTGVWDDTPAAAFGSAVLAQDPFEDRVSMVDRPPNDSRLSGGASRSPVILRIPVPDPFADSPVLVSSSGNELPSRLSNASSYESHGPGASTTSSRIGFAM